MHNFFLPTYPGNQLIPLNIPSRCNDTSQHDKYTKIHNKLMNYDDMGIFELTGCLSTCDKYIYSASPVNDLYNYPIDKLLQVFNITTTQKYSWLRFYVPSGEYEERQQVSYISSSDIRSYHCGGTSVHDL